MDVALVGMIYNDQRCAAWMHACLYIAVLRARRLQAQGKGTGYRAARRSGARVGRCACGTNSARQTARGVGRGATHRAQGHGHRAQGHRAQTVRELVADPHGCVAGLFCCVTRVCIQRGVVPLYCQASTSVWFNAVSTQRG